MSNPMSTETSNWQPGDPLHPRAQHPHSLYLLNYREETASEACAPCMDAATWPEPRSPYGLEDDPWADFTAWHRAHHEAQAGAVTEGGIAFALRPAGGAGPRLVRRRDGAAMRAPMTRLILHHLAAPLLRRALATADRLGEAIDRRVCWFANDTDEETS